MKKCKDCEEIKPLNFFAKGSGKDGLQVRCRSCHSVRAKAHYQANKDRYAKNSKSRTELFYDIMIDYLLDHPCVECGESDPLLLDFDHLEPSKKSFNISAARKKGSIEKLKEEMRKCQSLCVKCHRIKTAREGNWYVYRKTRLENSEN